jgi:hypothetical protein
LSSSVVLQARKNDDKQHNYSYRPGVVLQAQKNDNEKLCCSSSLRCGFARAKKATQLFIIILVWFCKCKKITMDIYVARHLYGVVL